MLVGLSLGDAATNGAGAGFPKSTRGRAKLLASRKLKHLASAARHGDVLGYETDSNRSGPSLAKSLCTTAAAAAAAGDGNDDITMLPAPPPPPHPIFGSPKGKVGGGGGGGTLVEALRPLISANARCWLVVSVGGAGSGGAGAAWHALDVARRATSICTTCIRLRWVCGWSCLYGRVLTSTKYL